MEPAKITLKNALKTAQKPTAHESRVSDFLSNEEKQQLRQSHFKSRSKVAFNHVDAFAAELIARFGFDFYKAWNNGEIEQEKAERFLLAERSRDAQMRLNIESVIMATVSSCIKLEKGQKKPKGLAIAKDIIKNEMKNAKGEF